MARLRYTGTAVRNYNGESLEPGDEIEATDYFAEVHSDRFELLESDDGSEGTEVEADTEIGPEGTETPPTAETDPEDTEPPDDSTEGGRQFDAEGFVDRTPMEEVVSDIETGEFDDELDAIESAEADAHDRDGVYDAIDERRDEA